MTSWPWMKNIASAVADAIPVDDGRPCIKSLIAEHRDCIGELRRHVSRHSEYDSNKHDDLWLLRFLLSHKKKITAATKAAIHTLDFRKEHRLGEKDLRYSPPGPEAACAAMQRYAMYAEKDTFQWTVPDPQKGVVTFIRYAGLDQHALVKKVDEDDWLPSFIYVSEWAFQWTDYISRTTGRLTKNIRLVDLAGFHLRDGCRENQIRDSKAMAVMEDCYPQLLHAIFVVNPPVWISIPWEVFRHLMPKRVKEKFALLYPATSEKDRLLLNKHIDNSLLPARFGGEYTEWPLNYPLPARK